MSTNSNGRSGATAMRRPRVMALAAGGAISIGAIAGLAHGQYAWTGTTSGQFNDTTKWLGGLNPPNSDPTATLTLTGGNIAAVTATMDTGYVSPVQVNSFTFNNANAFTIASGAAKAFQLTGTAPAFYLSGLGDSTISAPLQLAADTTVGGTGVGHLTLSGAISGAGKLIIPALSAGAGTAAQQAFHTVTLGAGAATYAGLTLDGGNMRTAGFGPNTFGGAGTTFTVTANGGVIQHVSNLSSGVGAATFQLDGTLRIIGAGVGMPLSTTLLNGAGSLVYNGTSSGAVSIQSNSTGYTGAVTVDKSDLPQFSGTVGGISLTGANGAVINAPSFDVRAGGSLSLSNTTVLNNNRIGDTAAINLRSAGNFQLSGTSAAISETVGALAGAGYSIVTSTSSSSSTTLTAASLARSERGTFLFRGTSLGNTAGARGQIVFTSDPSAGLVGGGGAADTTTISILPYAIGDTSSSGTGTSLVTYDAGGIRPLNTATEYAADSLASGATTNARLSAAVMNAGDTVNALAIATGGSVTGAGTLTITGGVILNGSTTGSIGLGNTVAFGSAEGNIFCTGTTSAASTLTIDGQLSGSNGLTKSGGGLLKLTNDNSGLTGTLTVNAGYIDFNAGTALPGTGQIIANGTGGGAVNYSSGLTYSGVSPYNLSRDILVNTGFVNLNSAIGAGDLTISGQITGSGGVFIQPGAATNHVHLTGNNTHTGVTFINGGVVHISSDANLGNGGALDMTSTLVLEGDWTTSRMTNFNAGATAPMIVDTNGHNAVLNGPLTSYTTALTSQTAGTLRKAGAGTLTITSDANTFAQSLAVDGGTLIINGTIPAHLTNAVTVNTGGTLGGSGDIYRNIVVNSGGILAPGSSAGILTENGNLTLSAGSTYAAELNGNTPGAYDQMAVSGTVTVTDAVLAPSLGYTPNYFDVLFIITNDGTDAITGTFAGLAEGASVSIGNVNAAPYTARISYVGDSATGATTGGNDVVLYNPGPACPADFNDSGTVSVQDIFDFLAAYFAGVPRADFNHSTSVSVQDIFDFLAAYFAGCP